MVPSGTLALIEKCECSAICAHMMDACMVDKDCVLFLPGGNFDACVYVRSGWWGVPFRGALTDGCRDSRLDRLISAMVRWGYWGALDKINPLLGTGYGCGNVPPDSGVVRCSRFPCRPYTLYNNERDFFFTKYLTKQQAQSNPLKNSNNSRGVPT